VTETLCGHEFSTSTISEANKSLDAALTAFSRRRLGEPYPYLILDARYERVREAGVITSQAVLIAVAVDGEGRRQVLANRESRSSWRDFLSDLRQRGLRAVKFVVSDDHPGLKAALREVLTEAVWQRCYVHFLRNALDYVPRKVDDDCLMELRWFGACPRAGVRPDPGDRRDLAEVRRDLAAWLGKWQGKYAKLCAWVEDNIEETLTFYRLPLAHHKHMKSTNMLERLNQEIKRSTHVARIFPDPASCLLLVRALAVEAHENWLEAIRYLNIDHLKEHQKPGGVTVSRPARPSLARCSPPSIGIGGHLAMPPLPHHRAYGSVPRRFGGLIACDRFPGDKSMSLEAFVGEGAMQCARRAQSPRSLGTEDGRTGHPLGDLQALESPVASATRLLSATAIMQTLTDTTVGWG
jgi:putative transposase